VESSGPPSNRPGPSHNRWKSRPSVHHPGIPTATHSLGDEDQQGLKDDNPPTHPHKLHPSCRTASSPIHADASSPSQALPGRADDNPPARPLQPHPHRGRQAPPSTLTQAPPQAPPGRGATTLPPALSSPTLHHGRQPPPELLTQTPPLLRALVVAPEQLAPSIPPLLGRCSPSRRRQCPPADRLRQLRRTAPTRSSSTPPRGRQAPPFTLTQTPPSPASPGDPPEQLIHHPSARAPPSSEPSRRRTAAGSSTRTATSPRRSAPPAPPNCSHPRKLQLHRGRRPSIPQGRVSAPETAASRGRPPFLRRTHPSPAPLRSTHCGVYSAHFKENS